MSYGDGKFLVFCHTRQEVEQLFLQLKRRNPDIEDYIKPYRAGYESGDRLSIENALRSGDLKGVIATSALELGVDLPNLDIRVLLGLPSTKCSLLQQAGRVGRASRGAVVILKTKNAFDNYYFNHPPELFNKPLELLVLHLENQPLMISHYACARAESGNFDNPGLDMDIFGQPFIRLAHKITVANCSNCNNDTAQNGCINCVDANRWYTYNVHSDRSAVLGLLGEIQRITESVEPKVFAAGSVLKIREKYATDRYEQAPRPGKMEKCHSLAPEISRVIDGKFPGGLYNHQAKAINYAVNGENVVICTGTASGKTIAFALPVLHSLLADDKARALFFYPTKALSGDQWEKLQDLAESFGLAGKVYKFDGDTPEKIRQEALKNGRILLCTPDMLHQTMLRRSLEGNYAVLFSNLRYVILDECHIYSGAFGSNMAYLLRRLRQVCRRLGGGAAIYGCQRHFQRPRRAPGNGTANRDFRRICRKKKRESAADI